MTGTEAIGPRLADDPEAFRACYEDLGPMVLAYVRKYVPADEAEDVRQQVFLEVWRSRSRYDAGRKLEPWVLAIAKRRAIDHLRRRSRNPVESTDALAIAEVSSADANFVDVHAEAAQLHSALGSLSDDHRVVLEMAYFDHLTQMQIADKLGAPLGTVKARTFRALRKLAIVLIPLDESRAEEEDL